MKENDDGEEQKSQGPEVGKEAAINDLLIAEICTFSFLFFIFLSFFFSFFVQDMMSGEGDYAKLGWDIFLSPQSFLSGKAMWQFFFSSFIVMQRDRNVG